MRCKKVDFFIIFRLLLKISLTLRDPKIDRPMKRSLFAVLCAAVLVSCGADPKGRGESESANPHACIGNLYTKGLEHVSGMVSGDGTVQVTAMTPQIIPDCVAGFVSAAFPDGRTTAGDAACIRLAGRVTSCADGYPVGATVSVAGTAVSAVSDRDGPVQP